MSSATRTRRFIPFVGRVRPDMETNALILMVSSILTGVLGVSYWIVAERFYPTDKIGQAAAMISTATMLSSLACLSLGGSYQRFLPLAGHRSRALILGGLVLTGGVALLLGLGFVVIGGSLKNLFESELERWVFPLIVVVLTAYALLDSVLTGLRKPGLVAAKNVSLSLLKLVPLPLLAFTASGFAVAGSWALLALLVVGAMLVYLLGGGLVHHESLKPQLPPLRELWAFQGASLAVTLVQTVTPMALPLIVLAKLGGDYAAYYNLVVALGVAVALLRANVLSSYVVEASRAGADRTALTRRMMRMMGGLCLLCSAGLATIGPLLLVIAGAEYAHAAIPLVLVMAVETLVSAVTAVHAALAFVSRRLTILVISQAAVVILTVGGAFVLVPHLELLGVGLSMLGAQLVAMAIIALPLRDELRRVHVLGGAA